MTRQIKAPFYEKRRIQSVSVKSEEVVIIIVSTDCLCIAVFLDYLLTNSDV